MILLQFKLLKMSYLNFISLKVLIEIREFKLSSGYRKLTTLRKLTEKIFYLRSIL